jgi:phosphomevalonate kinase
LTRWWRAPGKLVLLGEYAVLDGAPAVVVAIDRGVECQATVGGSELHISTPSDQRFVSATLRHVQAPAGHYVFTQYNPCNTPQKAGIGLSAAATVAATLAGQCLCNREIRRSQLFAVANKIHREVQEGGSGVDIAASTFGGLLLFQSGQVQELEHSLVENMAVVWAQKPALTGPRVKAYRSWLKRSPFVEESHQVTAAFAQEPLEALKKGRILLESMAAEAGIDYRTAELDHIVRLAEAHGGAAKPSGAGGGDCAVALFNNLADKHAFSNACQHDGLIVIPTQVAKGAQEVFA